MYRIIKFLAVTSLVFSFSGAMGADDEFEANEGPTVLNNPEPSSGYDMDSQLEICTNSPKSPECKMREPAETSKKSSKKTKKRK